MSILCFGEAIVDLMCERMSSSIEEADSYRPHFGGAMANVAVAARRAGAAVALAGGAGDDPWGRWLRSRLRSEGVDLSWFSLVAGLRTPVAFATFDRDGEPSFQVYGEGIEACVRSLGDRLEEAVGSASALVFGSNTLVGAPERGITLQARRLASDRGIPVLFDPNLREHRWANLDVALGLSRQLCEGAFCVRANEVEARAITGAEDPGTAAREIAALGARIAIVTMGAAGAVIRGAVEAEEDGIEVEVTSTLGAGDAFMGTLAAGLAEAGWDPARADGALARAVRASAEACTHWGALE
ncbi:MAG: carbohydrate kinase family protein [Solirubrobacterales bacterium]